MYSQIQYLGQEIMRNWLKKRMILKATFVCLFLFAFFSYDKYKDSRGRDHYFFDDVDQYYSYLPAYFIYDDLNFTFSNKYWLIPAENGNKVPKVTMGLALLNTPFFLIADVWAKYSQYERDGYSLPYSACIRTGALLYFFLGMLFLSKALMRFFSELTVAITCALLFLGTNLLYYTLGQAEYPHSYLFALFSIIIYLSIRWHENGKAKHILLIGLFGGLCTLIRPTAGFILLMPLLYGVTNGASLKEQIWFLWKEKVKILASIALFALVLTPQLLFWKTQTGNWLFFSYGSDERFFFGSPKIIEFLFSFRKGWLLYTPTMLFSVLGLLVLKEAARSFQVLTTIILVLTIYVFSSWWSWWFGGSFGMRSMVHYYSILAFPLAAWIGFCFERNLTTILCLGMSAMFLVLNLHQTLQYKRNMIHWDGMTKKAYWFSLTHPKFSKDDWPTFESYLDSPDYEAAKKVR